MNDMEKQLTYQELLAAYNKLLMENEFLHKEIDRLQALLHSRDIPMKQHTTKRHLSLKRKWMSSAICSRDVRMCLHGDGAAGQAGSRATSRCAGTNGTDNCVTRKSTSVQNVPTGRLNHWNMRTYTGILKGKVRTDKM